MEIHKLFRMMAKHGASDLHIKQGQPPVFRVNGTLSRMQNAPPLDESNVDSLLLGLVSDSQREELDRRGNIDFAYFLEDAGRFRCNLFRQCGYLSAAIRRVNASIPTYSELNLPDEISKCAGYNAGLVLIGGITGSGKSSTLAAILDDINHKRRCHILTIEDPIEYLFIEDKAIINQREIGIDVMDFNDALRAAVRQDPDVMLVGEMRDAETFETALTAAETGHLVFGTIHSSNCAQTIGRILDLFPVDKQNNIRNSLGFNLRAILNQKLLKSCDKNVQRVPAVETMFVSPIVRKLILDKEDAKIADAIRQDTEHGSHSYNQALKALFDKKLIDTDEALSASPNPEEMRMALRGISIADSGGII